jgi:DNA-binding NarL/FixJ family response regulator
VATSGELALQRLMQVQPDLVLLDMRMPGLDGLATCARIKEQARWRDVPVIFMTAVEEPEQKVAAFQAGAVDYVTKPFHTGEVLARIDTHLRLRELRRRLTEELAWREETERLLRDALEQGVLVAGHGGRIQFSTPRALQLLGRCFPGGENGSALPAELAALTSAGVASLHSFSVASGVVEIRVIPDPTSDGLSVVLIEEHRAEGDFAPLRTFGLSAREAEVLYWISQGKTNPEIGTIIGAASSTVKKHAESIFARLGVEGRSTAMLRALEVLGRSPE